MKNLKQLISEYLKEAKLMQIATVKDNRPWVASVWYVHDERWNLYFISRRNRRHSLELRENPVIAGAIVIPHTKGSGEKVRGLQFEGIAEEAKENLLKKAKEIYKAKYEMAEDIPLEKLSDPNWIATYYIIRPSLLVLFDEVNFPKQPRREIKL